MQEPEGDALYLRLSTTPIDQTPFTAAAARLGEEQLRTDVVAGGFRLREPGASDDQVILAACGAIIPEVLEAAELLANEEGVEATVLCLSSPDRLYHDWQQSRTAALTGRPPRPCHLDRLITPAERGLPIVSVIDGSSHALAFLGSALSTKCIPLGVDRFGQTGSQPEVYAEYGIDAASITTAALIALEP